MARAASQTDEESFQSDVIRFARIYGWKVHHSRKVATIRGGRKVWMTPLSGDPGYVDLTLAKNGVVLHVELKTETGSLSADQKEWQQAMGPQYRLWRPRDWHTEIVPLLSDGRATSSPHVQAVRHRHKRK